MDDVRRAFVACLTGVSFMGDIIGAIHLGDLLGVHLRGHPLDQVFKVKFVVHCGSVFTVTERPASLKLCAPNQAKCATLARALYSIV